MKSIAFFLAATVAASVATNLAGPAHADDESRLLLNPRQLIFTGKRSGEGYFSADGRQMIFQSERDATNPFFQMYLLDFASGETRRVSPGIGKTTCGWLHPDGRHLMFSSTHADPHSLELQKAELAFRASGQTRRYSWDFDPAYDIWQANRDGSGLVNLTHTPGYDAEGSYSPDGKLIAFASTRRAYDHPLSADEAEHLKHDPSWFMDLYLMNSDGSQVRQLTRVPGYDGGPFFSPDGQHITFRRFNEAGDKAEVWSMDLDGSHAHPLTRLGVMSWAPYYHPSGDYLIFTTNLHGFGNFELYLVDADGKQAPVRVTTTEGFDGLPVFSPDGRQLSWTSNRSSDGSSQLFIAGWNDAEARRLLHLPPKAASQSAPASARTDAAEGRFATHSALSAEDLRKRVAYLASPQLTGRLTGTPGEKLAADYGAEVFRRLGLKPAGDAGGYLQSFAFTAGVELGPDNRLASGSRSYVLHQDWVPLSLSASGEIPAQDVVFAGYGLRAPANKAFKGYDSYQHLDVKDKWVLVLRYWPEKVDEATQQELKRYSALPYKASLAKELGAKGLIVTGGPNSPDQQQLIPFHGSGTPGNLPALAISTPVAQSWFLASGQNLAEIQTRLDQGEAGLGFGLKPQLAARLDLKQIQGVGHNVLGLLAVPGATRTVVIGAHVDHLGQGPNPNSLAVTTARGALPTEAQAKMIHFGADDNASGSAGVLELAESLAGQTQGLKQNLLFALWSGEELGLLGSNHFVKAYSDADFRQRFSAYLNMDMVGRFDRALVMQGVGSSPAWPGLLEKHNFSLGLPLVLQQSAYLPTDATSFYLKGIPALSAFTGAHADYHTPGDTADKLNYAGEVPILSLIEKLALSLAGSAEAPAYTRQDPPKESQSRGLRVYLGTIPDYASGDVQGMRLSGVSAGGPAEKAGLQAGDVILELAGKPIANIYDYTYAIDTLKIGQPATVKIRRGDQTLTLTLIPGARD